MFRKLKINVFGDSFLSLFLALEGKRSHNPFEKAFFLFRILRISLLVYLNVTISQLQRNFVNYLLFLMIGLTSIGKDRNIIQRVVSV